jgi:dipeptidase E
MIATYSIRTASQAIKNPQKFADEEYEMLGPEGRSAGRSAKLVDFVVRPHLNSKSFPNIRTDFLEEITKDVKVPLFALDDESAVKVDGSKVKVVSEGQWKVYNEQ